MANPSQENGAITSHKSTTVTNRSMGNPSSKQNAGTNHATGHSKTTTATSPSRKNATKGKAGTANKKDDKIK